MKYQTISNGHLERNGKIFSQLIHYFIYYFIIYFYLILNVNRVTLHQTHVGLKGQWYLVNYPKHQEDKSNETISIVLEDDVVVSPFFFLWVVRSMNSYYTQSQQELHKELKEAINLDILDNSLSKTNSTNITTHHIDNFYKNHIGEPLILGISLSKQYLDPVHHPMELEIRNNFSPYLYRFLQFIFYNYFTIILFILLFFKCILICNIS